MSRSIRNNRSKIIFLNGVSNSGKTAIAEELQATLEEPYLHISVENFVKMMPSEYKKQITINSYNKRVITGMGYASLALLKKGLNLILEEVCYERSQMLFYFKLFKAFKAFYVGVHCPLEVILKREQQANANTTSTAANEIKLVHKGIQYDLEVNTAAITPTECAGYIKKEFTNKFFTSTLLVNKQKL